MNKGLTHHIEYAIYYIIIFLILRQWLIPVIELTDTGRYGLFLAFIALCLITYFLQLPLIVSWILKILYIAWFIMHVYNPFVPFSREALSFLIEEIRYNLSVIMQMDWSYVSDPFRSALFFILIWMLIYLIQHWIHVRSTIFYFFVLTVFFIATLDTFSPYDGDLAIVEIVILGLIMTAMLFVKRLVMRTDKVLEWKYYVAYLAPAILLTIVFGSIAFVMPKAAPQWPDPVPFIQNLSGKGVGSGDSGGATVGYSEDDSVLGGPFSPNDELVFTVQAKTKQYWRIETREIYTSRGWETAENVGFTVFPFNSDVFLSTNIGPEEEMSEAIVMPHADYNFILYPYGTVQVSSIANAGDMLLQNPSTEKIKVDGQIAGPYSIIYSEPAYSFTALKASTIKSDEVGAQYLQLPPTLPQRVHNMAQEITANQNTAYDKARAIQTYFGRSGFRYETDNVPVPAEGQDYVDQFLFETKFGYCDNFSTAMVVMLRSIGIPARWVKGFTGGDEVRSDNSELRRFEITNNNAHSWVEAYIGGVGWMPFEPTIGYTTPADITYDLVADETTDPQLLEQQEQERIEREEQELEQQEKEEQETAATPKTPREFPWRLLAAFVLLVGFIAFIAYKQRTKWLSKIYVQMQKNVEMDMANFEKSYERLLKHLASVGLKRKHEQTLQSYAKSIDNYYSTTHMKTLTDAYERIIYSRNIEEIDFIKMKESWEYLINRTSG